MDMMENSGHCLKKCGSHKGSIQLIKVLNMSELMLSLSFPIIFHRTFCIKTMERLYMDAQDGLKTIAPPLFLNIFFYFLLV